MFIGWLKFADVANLVSIAEEVGWLVDGYHLKLMLMHSPHLCYGAYFDGVLVGAVMAIEFERSAQIKYFMMKPTYQRQGFGKRLLETLLGALRPQYDSLYVHINPSLVGLFERYGFVRKCDVGRMLNVGKVPPFNFTNAHAKELDSGNFEQTIAKIDFETFGENRLTFLHDEMERTSSLKFTQPNGFQHSSVVNARSVYLGPWQVREGFDEEAEKMMRGVLYFRGLKKVYADIPLCNERALNLYKAYHFEKKATFVHMCTGLTCNVKFENIFAFSL